MQKYLEPIYSSQKSFYGKAIIETIDGVVRLYSYNTLAAEIVSRETSKEYIYMGKYSQTTTRHQKEFFKQNGLTDKEIKELIKEGSLTIDDEIPLF